MGAGSEMLLVEAGVLPLLESQLGLEVVGVGDSCVWSSVEDGPCVICLELAGSACWFANWLLLVSVGAGVACSVLTCAGAERLPVVASGSAVIVSVGLGADGVHFGVSSGTCLQGCVDPVDKVT
jgi:hypothetical protein